LRTRQIIFGVTCLAAWMAAIPTMAAAGLDYTAQSPTAAQIDDYLTRKNSPLAGIGNALSGYARDYDIDPRLVVAIAGAETTFGLHQCTDNNAWNWFHRRTCPQSSFASYQEGAEHVTRFLRLSYLNRGYDTIELIRQKYCASGCDNWVGLVTAFHDAMPANGQPAAVQPTLQPPAQPQTAQPNPGSTATPARSDHRILGVPLYIVFFLGALFVGAWALGALRR
jgi:hypothetical protein